MITKIIRVLLFTWFCIVCSPVSSGAQNTPHVTYRFELDTIHIQGNQTFANRIIIENFSNRPVQLSASANHTRTLNGLISLPKTIVLEASEKRIFPLKYIADRSTIVSNLQAFSLAFLSSDSAVTMQPAVSFFTKLNEESAFDIRTEQHEYYLDPNGTQTQILITCSNRGFVPITFRLIFTEIPNGLDFSGDLLSATIQPGSQLLLPMQVRNKSTQKSVDYNVTIQAINEEGTPLSTKKIRIISVGSVKRYGSNDDFFNNQPNNSITLRYLSMNQHSSTYQMQGRGNLELEKNNILKYNLNMEYYKNLETINLYDTYIDYQEKKWGIKAGNIFENLDYAIGGRGIKATYKPMDDHSVSIYAVENNYLLYSSLPIIPSTRIIAANYVFKNHTNKEKNLSYIYSDNTYRKITGHQLNGKTFFNVGNNQQLTIEGGYSVESTYRNTHKNAISAGVYYSLLFNDYQLNTQNYYGSSYYTGLKRGLTQTETRLIKKLAGSQSISARISLLINRPKYQEMENGYIFNDNHQLQIYEFGYTKTWKKFSLDVRPYLMLQKLQSEGTALLLNNKVNWKSQSVRSIANYAFFIHHHRLSINTDYGYTFQNTANKPTPPFHSFRINGSYHYQNLGFTSYIQINPYYLGDIYSAAGEMKYNVYSFGPNARFHAFNNKMEIQLASMYSRYESSNMNNFSINGNIRWKLRGQWDLTADAFYSKIQNKNLIAHEQNAPILNTAFNTRQIRVGIEKKFNQLNKSGRNKLELVYFEDHNNNGIRDLNESGIEGVLIKIDKYVAISNAKGVAKFQNIPDGAYTIEIINNNGWNTTGTPNILLTKNLMLEIPLVKTNILKGKIRIKMNKYLESQPYLAGIRINAVDRNGKQYHTLSDAEGNYSFYLPPSTYSVFIDTKGMLFSIENANNEIEIRGIKKTTYQLDFEYKDDRRKIEVKRF